MDAENRSERVQCPAGDGGLLVRNAFSGPVEYSCGHAWSEGRIVGGQLNLTRYEDPDQPDAAEDGCE